jgi:PAS domain S-box-containing protein
MFSPVTLFLVGAVYFSFLGLCGYWAEKRAKQGRDPTRNGLAYALSLTVYCTSWTFFGSVGSAAQSGMVFSSVYLGPTLMMFLAWGLIRRLIRLRKDYNISSLADLITQRYGQSLRLGMFITLVLLIGMVPYVGLQLRTVVSSFTMLTGQQHGSDALWTGHATDEVFIVLIALLTCVFGLRRVDLHVRQTGLLAVLAVESVVKLAAFVAVGLFVTYGLFDGLADLHTRLTEHSGLRRQMLDASLSARDYLNWVTYLLLSMGAVVLLPRMFHVMVVENDKESHLGTAVWLFPLYLLVISFFVMPIAAAGLLLGYPATSADWFVISLPHDLGGPALTLLAYLGGVSAAIGMVMVACTSMAMMFSNHIVLPLLTRLSPSARARVNILHVRWALVLAMLWSAYKFQAGLGNSYLLIQMGLISFASVIQFAPALLGALYWRRGSTTGAWWGLALGWTVWFYTLLLPATVRSVFEDFTWLTLGPWGVSFLRPEALFGLDLQSTLFNGVFWSLLLNAFAYVVASLLSPPKDNELEVGQRYLGMNGQTTRNVADAMVLGAVHIPAQKIWSDIGGLLTLYLPAQEAHQALSDIKHSITLGDEALVSGDDFISLTQAVETRLAGAIGAAMAHQVVAHGLQLSEQDALRMQATYTQALAELKITPQQLRERVDYFRSMTEMAEQYAAQLDEKVLALEMAAAARKQADAALQESESRFRSMADSAPVMVWMSDSQDGRDYYNAALIKFTGRREGESVVAAWTRLVHPDDLGKLLDGIKSVIMQMAGVDLQFRVKNAVGEYRWLGVQIRPRLSSDMVFLGLIGSALDISDLKEAEAVLRQFSDKLQTEVDLRTQELQLSLQSVRDNEETIRTITNSAQDAVIMLNAAGEVSFWNPAATRIFGWSVEQVIGLPLDSFLIPERFRGAHHAAYLRFQAGQHGSALGSKVELSALTRYGTEIPVELSLSATTLRGELHAVGLLRDITESKAAQVALAQRLAELQALNQRLEEAQSQLLQSEKMASIGQLAAGVAHEINNPVGFVSSNLGTLRTYSQQMLDLIAHYELAEPTMQDAPQLAGIRALKDKLDLGFVRDDLPALLTESEDGLRRVKKIVQDLKDFSHVNESEWLAADINAGLDATLNVVWNEIKYKATVTKHYGQLPPVECLASQLNQVFMNLLLNAVQSIEKQGTISITTVVEGDWVWIEVRDTGKGMTEEVKRRIFEPFFTTKPVGQGTGLGLSLSFGIINKHQGRIEVESIQGEGTVFRVWVPVKRAPTEVTLSEVAGNGGSHGDSME